MNHRRTLARAGAVLAAAALLVPAAPMPAQARNRDVSDTIQITVEDISPSTPTPTKKHSPLTVTLTLTNMTDENVTNVSVDGERGQPIANLKVLEDALANPSPPTSAGLQIPAHQPDSVDHLTLAPRGSPGASITVVFSTTTSTVDDRKGICFCHQGTIYPLFFSAHTLVDGVDTLLGVTATYLPAFDVTDFGSVAPDRVSWIWPLLDPPHRLTEDTVFTDDDLAASVAPDGRLSRALDVVEQVAAQTEPAIPLTLLIDPELLDELEVMADATTPYTVMTSDGNTEPGTGQSAASAWLTRLHTLLLSHPDLQVELTAYADPDVQSLRARGLTWSNIMPTEMAAHVNDALAGRPVTTSLAWPATGAITMPTLKTLVGQGVNTVVLNSTAVHTGTAEGAIEPGLARLRVGPDKDIAAALTSATVEKYVASAVTDGGTGTAALPELLSVLAVRAAQEPDVQHAVTITAPRYVDPDVSAAVRTIEDTSSSTFARPISLSKAVSDGLVPTQVSHLGKVPPAETAKAVSTLSAADDATGTLPTIRSLLDTSDPTAAAFVESLRPAIQRCESSAWRQADASAARRFAALLTRTVGDITKGVQIVPPTSGSYTLGSNTAPLPITVDNELQYPVKVRIGIINSLGVPGFKTKDIGEQTVEARQRRTFKIPTTIEHAGRIRIEAQVLTGGGQPLAQSPVRMTVHSTALGLIGVVITIVAGAVLGLALLWRLVRRLRQRRASGGPPPVPAEIAEPQPVP